MRLESLNSIIDYQILRGEASGDLKRSVQMDIGNGWQPFGNPVHVESEDTAYDGDWYQAMVKYED